MLRVVIVAIASFASLFVWLSPAATPPSWFVLAQDGGRTLLWLFSWLVPIAVAAAMPALAALLLRRKAGTTFTLSFLVFFGLTIWQVPSLTAVPGTRGGLSGGAWIALVLGAILLWLAPRLRFRQPHHLRPQRLRKLYAWLARALRERIRRSPFLTQFLVSWPHAVLLAEVRRWPWLHRALKRLFASRPFKAMRRTKAVGWTWAPRATARGSAPPPGARCVVICFDGTWNYPEQVEKGLVVPTNVHRLWDALEGAEVKSQSKATLDKRYTPEAGSGQVALYYGGIGNVAESSWLREKLGGVTGLGERAIRDRAYDDLVAIYQPGDQLFVFGFSRGAASARMFTDCIEKRGIPERAVTLSFAGRVFNLWRKEPPPKHAGAPGSVRISELGIWDTVGSFVIPRRSFQQILPGKSLDVSWVVDRAIHMVAIDETRVAFEPTLLNQDSTNERREVWFCGVHANVGGGHSDQRLADITLLYLIEHLMPRNQLRFRRDWMQRLKLNPDPFGEIRKNTGPFRHSHREIPLDAEVHGTAKLRMQPNSAYAPLALIEYTRRLAEREQAANFARQHLHP